MHKGIKKEITMDDKTSMILFKSQKFWDTLLPNSFNDSKFIDLIVTDFDFKNRREGSLYKRLSDLANKGVMIRLLYSKKDSLNDCDLELEDIFKELVLCCELPENNSRMLITEKIAFIGSMEIKLNESETYESGVLTEDKNLIEKLRKEFITELLEAGEFTNVPRNMLDHTYTLFDLKGTIYSISQLLHNKDNFLEFENLELIPKLRYWDDIRASMIKINKKYNIDYDWESIYFHTCEEQKIDKEEYESFKEYIGELEILVNELTEYFINEYDTKGKLQILKELKLLY